MNKTYVSTRNHQDQINFYQAIVQGIGDTLFPYTTLFRSESEERRVGKIGRAHV